ncbi:hypothetical protein MKW98_003206 [Papaver atlanticum]|uniref:Plant basic secretory protein (BSP) family protein n=1 Tax=Papaver atlanticum TaxID=357466 RepID=A0AAD4SM45_9MAGN|nr:hypothetical protein MKW98_003206 [Papaver atlanticum]
MAHNKMQYLVLSCLPTLAVVTLQVTQAVQYEVNNNAAGTTGGNRFDSEIGVDYSKQTLESATSFIWSIFRQSTEADKKSVQSIQMFVSSINYPAYTSDNKIYVNSEYIASYPGDVKREITGVLYHEATHIWQWNGDGNANVNLTEGIADFVRLKANYAPSHWVKPGAGDRWDEGYAVTAYFLDYCNNLSNGFVADLNYKMRTGYSDDFFFELLGKTVDQLWSDYKAQYASNYRLIKGLVD